MQVHSGVKPWTCDICSRTFLNKWNMIKHKETHGENRPFKCPICPYGAKVGEHLLAHIGTMHSNSFAYYCEICKKPWKRFSQLQVHMKRMHKGALRSSFGNSMKMDIKLEPGVGGDIDTGCDIISVKKIDPTKQDQFKHKRGRPPKIKKEPVDIDDVDGTGIEACADPVADVVESFISQQETPNSEIPLPVQIKHEVPSNIGSAKIVCFGDFRLPLATKGFPFNYDKNGKKPNSWFMNPENMQGKAADKQQAYLEKKERDFERHYGRKLGWRRLRLRKKPKPGISYNSVSLNELQDNIKCSQAKTEGMDETNDSVKLKKYEKRKQISQNPMELLVEGRKKLILMRKIKRRQKRWKQRMAEIMPSDDEFSEDESKDSNIRNITDPSTRNVNQIKVDEQQEAAVKPNQCSSDQDDDIPLSRLKNSEDLDDLPLSMLRTKRPAVTSKTKECNQQQNPNPDMTTENNLSNVPPKGKRMKRRLENAVGEQIKEIKKRKSSQETSEVMNTNFYSGSVRILGKTLVSLSESSRSIAEKIDDTDFNNKNTVSSSQTGNDVPLNLKGKKIENIVAKLKAKNFDAQKNGNALVLNIEGNVKKKVGRPKGSKTKKKVNHDTENKATSSIGQVANFTKTRVFDHNSSVLTKTRKGKPKRAKSKRRIDQIKPSDDSNATDVISTKAITETDISNEKSNTKLGEPKDVKNKVNDNEENTVEPIKIKKVGRPKGSKSRTCKKICLKKSKSGVQVLKKSKEVNIKPKVPGAILTLQSGKVYELKPGNIWDSTDKVSSTHVECTKSTQTPIQEQNNKTSQSPSDVPSGKRKSAELLSGKCKAAITVELKKKILDKLAKQKTAKRVLSADSDPVLGVRDTSSSCVNPESKKKIGRPKGSKNKVENKVSTASFNKEKKLKSKKIKPNTKDALKNIKQNKMKKNRTTNKQTKKSRKVCSQKQMTNLKVTRVKLKYKQQLKNNKSGINKLLAKKNDLNAHEEKDHKQIQFHGLDTQTVGGCLKTKRTESNRKTSLLLKKKTQTCAVGSARAKNKSIKQKSNQQVWYIDIERESPDDTTADVPLVQSQLAGPVFMQQFTEMNKPVISSTVTTPTLPIKSEPSQNVVKSEPLLMEVPTHLSYIMTAKEAEDLSIYRQHARAWGIGKEASHSYNDNSTINDLNAHEQKDHKQIQFHGIGTDTQTLGDETVGGCTFVNDVSLPDSNYVAMSERCYQKVDDDDHHLVDTSDLVKDFPNVQGISMTSECLESSEVPEDKNGDPFTNHSDCDNANNFLSSLNHGGCNVKNNKISYGCSKSEIANVDNSVPILSCQNLNIKSSSLIFMTSESQVKNDGRDFCNIDSKICVSRYLGKNSNHDFNQTTSELVPELVKRGNYDHKNVLENHHISSLTQNSHDLTLSDCNKTEANNANNNDICLKGSDDNDDLPKDSLVMAQLYSQETDKDFPLNKISDGNIHSFQDDVTACSSLERDNGMHVVKSSLNHTNDDLSYSVVLADSDTEEQLRGDVHMVKPNIKTEIYGLPVDSARVDNQ